jgi:hypothetical protein
VRLRECHKEVALKGIRMIMNLGLMVDETNIRFL